MAVGGLSGNTSSSLGLYGAGTKGFGGLASGLDTESLIEGMTIGTRAKIQKFQSQNQKYQWQMNGYRGISDMLVKFSNKYLDVTSPNSPMRSSFFNNSLVALSGANSKFLSVTGGSSALDNMQILAIKQMAKDASMTTNNNASNQIIDTGSIDFDQVITTSNLSGGNIKVTLNNKDYNIEMKDGEVLEGLKNDPDFVDGKADYSTAEKAVKSFNAKLASIDVGGEKLSAKMEMAYDGSSFSLKAKGNADGNLFLKGGSENQLKMLGFLDDDGKVLNNGNISSTGYQGIKTLTDADLVTNTSFEKYFADKEMKFTYNGVTKTIKMPSEATLQKWKDDGADRLDELKNYMNKEIEKSFGKNKVTIDFAKDASGAKTGGLSFSTVDPSSVLSISSNSDGLMGKTGVFGITSGTSNRLNITSSLKDVGLVADGAAVNLEINGVKIEGLTSDSSVKAMIEAINKSDAGVKVSYLETADKFSISSTVKGAAGEIKFNQTNDGNANLAHKLFGDNNFQAGQDAIMTVKYEGNVEMDIARDSNSFNLDGATFKLTGTFGYDKTTDSLISGTEAVTFSSSVDTDKITKVISEMVKDYNDLVDSISKQTGTKPDKRYTPLTEEQKKDMSKDEIEKWEEKAKEGVLYNDSLLNSLKTKLRVVFSGSADMGVLKDMGLDMGNSYTSNGKITFDEEKFKGKLQEDPEAIRELFQREASGTDGGGITARFKSITEEFAKTTGSRKGLLIEKAGSEHAATSLIENSLKKLMEEGEDRIDSFKVKLQNEIDRYTKEFTALEKLVSQMNSQSSYLSSLSM